MLEPLDAETQYNLGVAHQLAGDAAAAAQSYRHAIAFDPAFLDGSHLYHAVRADLLARDGRPAAARAAYDRALELVHNDAERRFLAARRAALGD